MDIIFEGRYFNVNRKFLMIIGQWPYKYKAKNIIKAFSMTLLFLLSMPHLISAIVNYEDVDRLMLNTLCFLSAMVMILKCVAMNIAGKQMKNLCENIAINWRTIRDQRERKILVEYSERGRLVTIAYSIFMITAGSYMALLPLIPKILDRLNPLEEPRTEILLSNGEFFVDRKEHYVEVFFCDFILVEMAAIICIAVDSIYIVSVENCCAMNAIISYRLRDVKRQPSDGILMNSNDSYNHLIHIFQLHRNTLSFTSMLNDSYSLNFLFIMTVNLVIIPLSACAIIANLEDGIIFILPYASFLIAIMLHIFVLFWPGQRILDHNLSLCDNAYCNEWYTTPPRTQKLLLIFMLRCSQPAVLSAGGLFLVNFETFSSVVRTAVSYITVLASFR